MRAGCPATRDRCRTPPLDLIFARGTLAFDERIVFDGAFAA